MDDYCHKSMFGGVGYFMDGLMFGAIMDNVFRLKADKQTIPKFEAGDCGSHEVKGRKITTYYFQVPQNILEDKDELKIGS